MYIRNFKDNSYGTYVVIQDDNGRKWVIDVTIEDNWSISVGKFLEVDAHFDRYTAEQYEKVSFKKEVTL